MEVFSFPGKYQFGNDRLGQVALKNMLQKLLNNNRSNNWLAFCSKSNSATLVPSMKQEEHPYTKRITYTYRKEIA